MVISEVLALIIVIVLSAIVIMAIFAVLAQLWLVILSFLPGCWQRLECHDWKEASEFDGDRFLIRCKKCNWISTSNYYPPLW